MNACEKKTRTATARLSVSFRGLERVAAELDNGHGGRGVSEFHLRKVLRGERESEFLLGQVRERFPQLLPAGGTTWDKAGVAVEKETAGRAS